MSLQVEHITFSYSKVNILSNVGLNVQPGEILGLLGPNGTGKTTLLKCINRVLEPKTGKTVIYGQDILTMGVKKRAQYIGYVPQHTNMMFPGTVVDTVMMGRVPYVDLHIKLRDKEIVFSVLQMMNLEQFAFQNIARLSGGERQRVFIARALAQEPKVLLLDEPTSNLDLKNQLRTLQLIRKLVKEKQLTVVMTIHDLNLAAMFCDSVLMLKDSKVFAYGNCKNVITTENIAQVYGVETQTSVYDDIIHTRLLNVVNQEICSD